MASNRLFVASVLVLATLPLDGCGDSGDTSWPVGTEAVVVSSDTGVVRAFVPKDQQTKVGRDFMLLGNRTSVVIVCDIRYSFTPAGTRRNSSPTDRVRVRILEGHQAVEVFIRRQELAPKPLVAAWEVPFILGTIVLLFAAAGFLWTIETLVLFCLIMRLDRTELLHVGPLPMQTLVNVAVRVRRRSRRTQRTDEECERWREWIADRTARRKAVCARLSARRAQDQSRVG